MWAQRKVVTRMHYSCNGVLTLLLLFRDASPKVPLKEQKQEQQPQEESLRWLRQPFGDKRHY